MDQSKPEVKGESQAQMEAEHPTGRQQMGNDACTPKWVYNARKLSDFTGTIIREASWCGVMWAMDETWCWSAGAFSAHQRILAGSGVDRKSCDFGPGVGPRDPSVPEIEECVSVLCFIPVVPALLCEGICTAYTVLTTGSA
ncbi:hypothetical protein B0H17DRAFT_1127990 [Mycena rosella]|uniref:Uncharacterized protein n=1 Tax=Mycena rosella TaxID=1033263 RepID=A0AAD7GMJ8_MYCRO|nr:hypothetical protein B0H17DRAFT_1127990 [Mycena rosella]